MKQLKEEPCSSVRTLLAVCKDSKYLYISNLKPASKKLVLNLEEVSSAHLSLKGLIEDGEPRVILYVLPTCVTVADGRG